MAPEIEAAPRTTQSPNARKKSFRVYFVLTLFIALRALGNLSLAWGTKHQPQALSIHPLAYLQSMLDPFVATGIAMLILALFARLALLSLADLSFVLPVTAIGYVLAAILGKFVLHEQVTSARWLAAILIFAGAALVGSTPQDTTRTRDAAQ
jgi:drug/metabolite transporter (DMT)-like permease